MMLRNSRVGKGTSAIALLGASTILLAAAGETMWHANVAASEGRWAGPTVGVPAVANAADSALAAKEMTETMTVPVFKPFVLVRIPLPEDYSAGEVMAVNEAGQAVGWMHYDTDNRDRAFYFDPAEGVTILDLNTQQHDASWAYGISNDATPVIAGAVMWKGNPDYLRGCKWTGPAGSLTVPFGTGVVSTIYAVKGVTSTTTLAGMYVPSSVPESVVYGSTLKYPASGLNGEALALNSSGKVVGWHMVSSASHAYSWVSDTTTDIHPGGAWDSSGATAINENGDIGGWAIDAPGGAVPAMWEASPQGFYTFSPFSSVGAQSEVSGINSYGEMAITNTTTSGGGALWQVISSANVANNFNTITLMPDAAGLVFSTRAINDNLWIGGSYKATSQSAQQPCLIIPYDVDNDGDPDYREIVNGVEDDVNENWLIDWAEHIGGVSGSGMRVGLHAPDDNIDSRSIANTQIVRWPLQIRNLNFDDGAPGDINEWPLNEILDCANEETLCADFVERIENWSRDVTYGQREIVFWLRSTLVAAEEDYDFLPDGLASEADLLADIHEFGYRFARCIDYVKTGNEVFGGAGGYKFYEGQIGCEWTGTDPKAFQSLPFACREMAADNVIEWLGKQAWAAIEGSALAGRPLRIIGPGIQSGLINGAYDNPSITDLDELMQDLTTWCNDNQIYFDLHVLYVSLADAEGTIQKFTDTYQNPPAAPWDTANWAVCMELGPVVELLGTWDTEANHTAHYQFRHCGNPVGFVDWHDFVEDWRTIQFQTSTFSIAGGLAELAAPGGDAARAFAAVCYGPTIMHDDDTRFSNDMGCLRATQVCSGLMPSGYGSNKYTPLKQEFVTAASAFVISGFNPHPGACTACGCD